MLTDTLVQTPYSLSTIEDRCAPRTRIAIPACLRLAAGRSFQTTVCDISISGFSATAISRMPLNAKCWLAISGLEGLQAEVVWWSDSQVGGAFANLLSPIVLDHLIVQWQGTSAPGHRN
jgi:hypothetical protein